MANTRSSFPRDKSYDWMCLFYPESCDFDVWVKSMRFNTLTGLISPLHDPDPEDKKPHYHALFHFGGRSVTAEGALYILGDLPANGHLEKPSSVYFGCERYWVHYDHPDRQQWYEFDEPYEAGRFCTVLGNYQFHDPDIEKTDKLILIFDCYYNEFLTSCYKREKSLEYNAFMRFLRDKHIDLLPTAIRNSYNLKSSLNIY